MNMQVQIQEVSRPCLVHFPKEEVKRGIFHGWFQGAWPYEAVLQGSTSGFIQHPRAVVETEDGHVHECAVGMIQFLDSDQKFDQYYWPNDGDA